MRCWGKTSAAHLITFLLATPCCARAATSQPASPTSAPATAQAVFLAAGIELTYLHNEHVPIPIANLRDWSVVLGKSGDLYVAAKGAAVTESFKLSNIGQGKKIPLSAAAIQSIQEQIVAH